MLTLERTEVEKRITGLRGIYYSENDPRYLRLWADLPLDARRAAVIYYLAGRSVATALRWRGLMPYINWSEEEWSKRWVLAVLREKKGRKFLQMARPLVRRSSFLHRISWNNLDRIRRYWSNHVRWRDDESIIVQSVL